MEDNTCYVVEQFVGEAMDFSSQYGSDSSISYTAHNIVGRPTKFPSYGDFSQTFVMRDYGPWWRDCPSGQVFRRPPPCPQPSHCGRGDNFIDVKFDHAVFPFRIHVYETYNPGGLVAIWAGDCLGGWQLLWSESSQARRGSHSAVSQQPRQFSPPIQTTDFATKLLRLEFDSTSLSYYTEIDAVCLLGTLDPITPSARAMAMLPPAPRSPLLSAIIKRKLHVVPHPRRVLQACAEQLNRPSLENFTRQMKQRETSPETHDGCFELLPREVIIKIFSYLDLISLVRVSAVCRSLRLVARDPWLYTCVDLRQAFFCVSDATLAWLAGVSTKLARLDMAWCGNYGSMNPANLASFLTSVSGSLTRLDLDNCHIATGAVMTSVGTQCRSLTHLSLANCHLLKPQDFQTLTQLESLVSLNLYRTSIGHSCVISLLCNNRGLENLCLAACNNINGDEVCLILSHCQPSLRVLDLWRCSSLTARGVASLGAGCPLLEDLDLGWCLNVQASSGAILSLTEQCRGLKRLYLTAHRQTGDRELSALTALTSLEQLDILGNRNVSLGAVSDLLARLTSLRMLDVSFCHQLGEENIGQLVTNYPGVSIKWSWSE